MSRKKFIFSKIMVRLKKTSGAKNNTALASLLGFKPAAFSLRKKENSIPYEEIISYADKKGKSTDWIFFGRGKPEEDGFDQITPEEKE
ncbi:MAG: helix-turn-helix domain containing protein, partial [Deltaproteobacteria bacterium]|nr:helix-turn-helix domain containing protein [Deltaproteobacteria bacterium]